MNKKTVRIIVFVAAVIIALSLLRWLGDLVLLAVAVIIGFFVYKNWDELKKLWKRFLSGKQ